MFSELDLIMRYKFVDDDPLMIDVGAHHGFLTIPFARAGWSVIAFEPENSNFKAFKENLRNFGKVRVFKEAVSDVSGKRIPFYVSEKYYGIHSLRKFDKTHKLKYWVKSVRLDEKLKKLNVKNVTLLKIDIEGADFLALKSFDFKNYSPGIVMVEFMDSRTVPHFGYRYTDMVKFMKTKGYTAYVSEWEEIEEYGREGVATVSHTWISCVPYSEFKHKPSWGNLIFVPQKDSEKFDLTLQKYLKSLVNFSVPTMSPLLYIHTKALELFLNIRSFINDLQVNFIGLGRIGIIDVGSAGGLPNYWESSPGLIKKLIRFEPRGSLNLNKSILSKDIALWKSNSVKNFYIYKGYGGTGSSLFRQNYNYVKKNYDKLKSRGSKGLAETWFDRSSLLRTEKIHCKKLDTVLADNKLTGLFDFLKIDAQGAEYEILLGSKEFLKNDCIAIFLESFSIPLYTGIKLLPDIVKFLSIYNFRLIKKFPPHGSFASQNDCLFIKRRVNLKKISLIKETYEIHK